MQLAFLNPLFEHPGPWASVYVDLSRPGSTPARRSLEADAVLKSLVAQEADEPTVRAVDGALRELRDSREPVGRALFAAQGEIVLDRPLTVPPGGTRALWGTLPHVAPLLELADDDPVCLVAAVDRRGADLELRGSRGTEPAGRVTTRQPAVPGTDTASEDSEPPAPVSAEYSWEQNAELIAEAVTARQERSGAELVVLVGDERVRRAVHDRLPRHLLPRTVESGHGGRSAGSATRLLDDDVERARQAHVRGRTEGELERFAAARATDGERAGAAEGVPALVEAAREHRIAELLVRPAGPDAHRTVWIGRAPDQLATRRTDTRFLGEPEPAPARADDALLRAAAATGAAALAVRSERTPEGGLGALLRWS
ncbi:hypothetical protein [Streptomyces sp. NPDC002564]|uniref:baeRF2 domain-containing protein n=1 Tax=Streptomyces sp. NPDC002564 TaxID=3364649 RepID=UPI00369B0144